MYATGLGTCPVMALPNLLVEFSDHALMVSSRTCPDVAVSQRQDWSVVETTMQRPAYLLKLAQVSLWLVMFMLCVLTEMTML